jgi:hypothetical protein
MNFTPKSETQLEEDRRKRMKVLKKGEADFVVRSAVNKLSQKDSTEMIELQVECTDADGTTKVIKDWLHPAMEHRIRHFCYATGLGAVYERGELDAEHCEGRGGRCMIVVEKSDQYGDQNKVKDYVVAEQTKTTTGYQNAKGGAQQKPEPTEAEKAKRRAWEAFKAKFPEVQTTELQGEFRKAVADYFPAKKPELIGAGEWDRFVRDGFAKSAESPVSDEPVFAESDIPF